MRATSLALCMLTSLWSCTHAATPAMIALENELSIAQTANYAHSAAALISEAQAAFREAEQAHENNLEEARDDLLTRARLLQQAAQYEAQRHRLDTELTAIETQTSVIRAQIQELEEERRRLVHENNRLAAARVALAEADRAFRRAEEEELGGRRRGQLGLHHAQDIRRASTLMLQRAQLMITTARSAGIVENALEEAAELSRQAEAQRNMRRQLQLAHASYQAALRALATTRTTETSPSQDEVRTLLESLRHANFHMHRLNEGIAIELDGLFAGNTERISRSSRTRLDALASLLRAHPSGPILIQVVGGSGGAIERRAESRSNALRAQLIRAGVNEERLTASTISAWLRGNDSRTQARIVLVAYTIESGD